MLKESGKPVKVAESDVDVSADLIKYRAVPFLHCQGGHVFVPVCLSQSQMSEDEVKKILWEKKRVVKKLLAKDMFLVFT